MASSYQRLHAYRTAAALADELHSVVASWSSLDQWTTGVQLLRAADSIGANIAEAESRKKVDRRRFLIIARGSLQETEHWLARAGARKLLGRSYDTEVGTIARTLSGLIRRLS